MAMLFDDPRKRQQGLGTLGQTGGAMGQSFQPETAGRLPGLDGGGLFAGGGAMGQSAGLPGLNFSQSDGPQATTNTGMNFSQGPMATTNTGLSNGMGLGQLGNPGAMTNSFAPTEGDF
ncbi:MAG: hypothetical protein V4636_11625, partial [Pseudomonadota bacterium]